MGLPIGAWAKTEAKPIVGVEQQGSLASHVGCREGLPAMPEIPVWLVGHRALRNLPRIKAVWTFLEELVSELT